MTDTSTDADDLDPTEEVRPGGLRRVRRALWIAVAVGAVMATLVVVLATRQPAAQRSVESPLVGRPAPPLAGATVDGGRVDIDDLRGRWVLVNYFATWCVPCRREHPDLVRFHQRHQARGDLEVVGVVYSDSSDAVRDFRRDNGGTWPMVEDPDGRIALDWGVAGVPESFLVSPGGVVVAKLLGGVTDAQLEQLLTDASGGS
ncbi:MAG: TlpA family protein disulfide reductase [Acidimicrobiales bacterium]